MLLIKDKPSKYLIELAKRHGIDVSDNVSVEDLFEEIQEKWTRTVSRQYEISLVTPELPEKKDLFLFKKLGLIDVVTPPPGKYEGSLLLGATVNATRRRLAFLLQQNISIRKLYMLGSQRILRMEHETPEMLFKAIPELPFKKSYNPPTTYEDSDLPKTEAEMIYLIYEQSEIPKEWEVLFTKTSLKPNSDSKTPQPNTTDTLRDFLELHSTPGKYLLVSNQPFVQRQTLNALSVLPSEFEILGMGQKALPSTPLRVFLDEIVRLLYEELKRNN